MSKPVNLWALPSGFSRAGDSEPEVESVTTSEKNGSSSGPSSRSPEKTGISKIKVSSVLPGLNSSIVAQKQDVTRDVSLTDLENCNDGICPSDQSAASVASVQSAVDFSVFDRALNQEKVVLPKSLRSDLSEVRESEKKSFRSVQESQDESIEEQESSHQHFWQSDQTQHDDETKSDFTFSQQSNFHKHKDQSRTLILSGSCSHTVHPPTEIVYVKSDRTEIAVTLASDFEDAARLTVKDVSDLNSHDVRITVCGETRIEHYNRHGRLVFNKEGIYILNSLHGAVTFRYSAERDVWTIESQLVGAPRC